MGGRAEKHSSHSFRTPLQLTHTSDLLRLYKRRWWGKASTQLTARSIETRLFIVKRFYLWKCGNYLSLRCFLLRWWETNHSSLFSCCKVITLWSALMIKNVYAVFPQVSAKCPKECRCPPTDLSCAAGVSVIPDSCVCCKVCARQLFEDCSKTRPCDHTKGLECNFGGGFDFATGICRGTITCSVFFRMNLFTVHFSFNAMFL